MLRYLAENQVLFYATLVVGCVGVCLELLLGARVGILVRRALEAGEDTHPFLEKLRKDFTKSYKMGGNVNNVDKFVDKYVNKQKFLGIFLYTWEKRCGQTRIAGGFLAGISLFLLFYMKCGKELVYQQISMLVILCTVWISMIILTGNRGKKRRLCENLAEYLENSYLPQLELEQQNPVQFAKICRELEGEEKQEKPKKKVVHRLKKRTTQEDAKREELARMKEELKEELKEERFVREQKSKKQEKQEESKPKPKAWNEPEKVEKPELSAEKNEQLLRDILKEYLGEN